MRRHLAIVFTLLLCVAMIARAQKSEPDALSPDSVGRVLTNVEVAAARRVATASVQGMSSGDLVRQGVTDFTDAIRRFSGVNIRDYGGAGGMKTLSVHSMGATHTGVIYDGIAITDCESGATDLSRFSLEQIDSIALTVGDAPSIFTTARQLASAAALVLVKCQPRSNSLTLSATGGSFGLAQANADGSLLLPKGWSARLQGQYMRADNRYPFTLKNLTLVTRERRNNNAISRGYGELNLYHDCGLQLKLYCYSVAKELPGQVVVYNPVADERDNYTNAFAQAGFQRQLLPRLAIKASAKVGASREKYYDFDLAYARHDSTRVYDQAEAYASLAALFNATPRLDLSLAADYHWQELKSVALDCTRPHRDTFLEALRMKWRGPKGWTATAALLMSSYLNNVDQGTAAYDCHRLSPSASVAWSPAQWLTARAYYKDSFRPATFSDNYYTHMGNRNLRPEKARTLGWGADFHLPNGGGSQTLLLEAYRAWVDDKIVAMPVSSFFWNMVNVGHVSIWGAELRSHGQQRVNRGLSLEHNVSYTFQEALNTTDPAYRYYRHQIAYTPRHAVSGSLTALTPWINAAVNTSAMTERWSSNENLPISHIDGHNVWNIAAWRELPLRADRNSSRHSARLTLRGELLNVFDTQYDIVRLYPMPGRQYKLTLTYNYL